MLNIEFANTQSIRERLIKDFSCFPVFLDHGMAYRVFDIFCQSVLSPLFHHIIELAEEGSEACWNWYGCACVCVCVYIYICMYIYIYVCISLPPLSLSLFLSLSLSLSLPPSLSLSHTHRGRME